MEGCIFCKINNGEIPKKEIYNDDLVSVILDIYAKSSGHLLIIPKEHIKDITEVDEKLISHINGIIKKMISILEKELKCDGVEVVHNYGINQEIKHFHMHLIPMYVDESERGYGFKKHLEVDEVYNILK